MERETEQGNMERLATMSSTEEVEEEEEEANVYIQICVIIYGCSVFAYLLYRKFWLNQ